MIKEEYVSFETAKLLKEKGFDEECMCYYDDEGDFNSHAINPSFINHEFSSYFTAPTQQMAMRWLRENHGIFIEIQKTMDGTQYVASLWKGDWYLHRVYGDTVFQTYESAAEFGIRAACEHL
jgi:hypothetical protein